ncbi:MAG TPA: ABC transporter ATP-binding protein [Burkholderiales bacterium]|nr:ABC transporter ATP-binding protein [Burkholderiales bacterium]
MTSILVADHLTKWYGPRLAVDDVSFEVQRGEVVGLLGPNGSGKSTILRLLTGYLRPSRGTARIAGFDVVAQGLQARNRIGYVPEDVPLYTHMRVTDFLAFMARLRGLSGAALVRAVDSVVQQVSLDTVRHLLISKLSRGYRQRVAIAQALISSPELLVLDEPTNGLDPRQIIELRELIRSLASDRAILVTSHVLAEIERVAHRAAILLNGRLLTVHTLARGDRGSELRVQIRAEAGSAVQACLKAVAGVLDARLEAQSDTLETWRVSVSEPVVGEQISQAVTRAGFGMREITTAASDLEDLFLRLTAQEQQR